MAARVIFTIAVETKKAIVLRAHVASYVATCASTSCISAIYMSTNVPVCPFEHKLSHRYCGYPIINGFENVNRCITYRSHYSGIHFRDIEHICHIIIYQVYQTQIRSP